MARIEGLPPPVRSFIETYEWQQIDPVPWTEPHTQLPDSRIGLVVTACMTMPGQPPFQAEEAGNDPTVRVVPSVTDPDTLVNTYPGQAFDHAGLEADANLLIPLDRLREMAVAGEIGSVGPRTMSLCGHIVNPDVLMEETAPGIARLFEEDRVDVGLLVPA